MLLVIRQISDNKFFFQRDRAPVPYDRKTIQLLGYNTVKLQICLYVPILLCFPEQLSHLPYSFWR